MIQCPECNYEFNVIEMKLSTYILNIDEICFKCPCCQEYCITMKQKEIEQ